MTLEFIDKFADENFCRQHLAEQRWGQGPAACHFCGMIGAYVIEGGKRYKCASKECAKKFSVTTGTIFENTKLPLRTWFAAMWMFSEGRSRTSSVEVAKKLGVTQFVAWRVFTKLRMLIEPVYDKQLSGVIEMDEAFFGRRWATYRKPTRSKDAMLVIGLKERGGDVRLIQAPDRKAKTLSSIIAYHVKSGSTIYTDGHKGYLNMDESMTHDSVIHKVGEWVRGDVHTNQIESVWGRMKKAIRYAHHSVSPEFLQLYCNEFEWKENTRSMSDAQRFEWLMEKAICR